MSKPKDTTIEHAAPATQTAVPAVAPPTGSPLDILKGTLMSNEMAGQLRMVLPAGIPPERFQRVVLTAVMADRKLLNADRASLFNACLRCAQDGLLPDGKEAALVIFKSKDRDSGQWIAKIQYMPMVYGIIKKARGADVSAITAHVVYSGDQFTYALGDDERIEHVPTAMGVERGERVGVYAVATLDDGTKVREIMTLAEVEEVRAISRAKDDGPWVTFWDEMAEKTAIRRLLKRIPADGAGGEALRRVLDVDDEIFALPELEETAPALPPPMPDNMPEHEEAALAAAREGTVAFKAYWKATDIAVRDALRPNLEHFQKLCADADKAQAEAEARQGAPVDTDTEDSK